MKYVILRKEQGMDPGHSLEALSSVQLVYSFGVIAAAYFVRGITGFGSGLIAIPLLVMKLPLATVVPLVVTLDYIASASQGLKDRQHIRWREIFPLLPFTVFGVGLALYLLKTVETSLLLHSLAIFILLYAAYSFFSKAPSRSSSRLWAAPFGGFGGLVGTLFGTGGPFYVIYLQWRALEKSQFRATFAAIFLLDGTYRIVGYAVTGFFNVDLLLLLAVLLPVMGISVYLGGRVHTEITPATFKRGVSLLLLASGIALLLK